ncbi:hypothetical protein [Hymenobacter lucidus]|uniref:DUF4177 domain-containing protein n=1 Tax=Hymenobacter lucidus TaxID=2880930 RepID=A0ABS8ANU8_9BACT|nr:hypothetical protein [Hymenobacter lucidus]MCB2406981.1 hypothetical protein [Hymenobacter lucidus]
MPHRLLAYLLPAALLLAAPAVAQSPEPTAPPRGASFPKLPETAFQATTSSTLLPATPGVRYQYQLVHLYDDEQIYLAPAWRGQTVLKPVKVKSGLFTYENTLGELDGLLMTTLNELAADGWELLEIQNSAQPTSATQQVETSLRFNDPQRPIQTGTTSISTLTQTRYLFRKAR